MKIYFMVTRFQNAVTGEKNLIEQKLISEETANFIAVNGVHYQHEGLLIYEILLVNPYWGDLTELNNEIQPWYSEGSNG